MVDSACRPPLAHPPVRLGRGGLPLWVEVVLVFGGLVLANEVGDDGAGLVELGQALGEGARLLVRLHEGVAFAHAVVLPDNAFEELEAGVSTGEQRRGEPGLLTVAILV